MSDYISRNTVIELVKKLADGYTYLEIPTIDLIEEIKKIPAADVKPIRSGRWVYKRAYGVRYFECSVCGFSTCLNHDRYCQKCGAEMGGERMKTKYDIGEEVLIRAKVKSMIITTTGTDVELDVDSNNGTTSVTVWEDNIVSKKEAGVI